MNALLSWFAETSVVTAVLVLIALALSRLFRARPGVQHAIWTVVLLRFLTPTLFEWPWRLPRLSAGAEAAAPSDFTLDPHTISLLSATGADAAPASPSLTSVLTIIAIVIWAAGALTIAARMGRRIHRQSSRIRRGGPATVPLAHAVRQTANHMRIRPVPARIVRGLAAPFVWCFGRPTLAWPESMLAARSISAARPIIAHELAHIRRRDHWIAWLELAAMVVWWWNPFFWVVRRNLRISAEMACDALALASYPDDRCAYAETLLRLSTASPSGSSALVVGMSASDPSSLERRMSMIASDRVSGKLGRAGLLVAGFLALASLPGWTGANPAQPEPRDEAKRKFLVEALAAKWAGQPELTRPFLAETLATFARANPGEPRPSAQDKFLAEVLASWANAGQPEPKDELTRSYLVEALASSLAAQPEPEPTDKIRLRFLAENAEAKDKLKLRFLVEGATAADEQKVRQLDLSARSEALTTELQLLLADHAAGGDLDGFEELVAQKLEVMAQMKRIEAAWRLRATRETQRPPSAAQLDQSQREIQARIQELEAMALKLGEGNADAGAVETLKAQQQDVAAKMKAIEAMRRKVVKREALGLDLAGAQPVTPPTPEQLDAKRDAILDHIKGVEAQLAVVAKREDEGAKADLEKLDLARRELLENLRWLDVKAAEARRQKPAK